MHPAERAIRDWLEEIVIGLQLCPFAAAPFRVQRIRFALCEAVTEAALMEALERELQRLSDTPATELETTLLIVPQVLQDFGRYSLFLEAVDTHLAVQGWSQTFQVASFHPDYQFSGSLPDDPGNLTNRSPVPVLHLLREDSVSQAVDRHPDVEGIPAANIRRMEALSPDERRARFPWVVDVSPAG